MIRAPYIQNYIYTEPEIKTPEYVRISSYYITQDKQINILFSTHKKAIPAGFLGLFYLCDQ